MIAVFDLGNSELRIGIFDNDTLINSFRIKTDRNKTRDEYSLIIKDLLISNKIEVKNITGTILSSVVPELTLEIKESISKVLTMPIIVGPGIKTGLALKCDNQMKLEYIC